MRIGVLALACAAACSRSAPPPRVAATAPPQRPEDKPVPAASIDARDASGWTALQRAAESGDVVEIDRLVQAGANLEASSPKVYAGATALVIALEFAHPEAAKLLLDRGASIAGPLGSDALVLAAGGGSDAIVDVLLARGVAANGTRALHAAARYGHTSTIERLIGAGAGVNEPLNSDHGFTPLINACIEGQLEAARALLDAGARVNDRDDEGVTALHWAVYAARPEERHIYRKLGGPHDTRWIPRKDAPLVSLLIDHGASLEAADHDGNTPLHQAALMDAQAAAELLVRAGANRGARNREAKTPYELAQDRHNSVEPILKP